MFSLLLLASSLVFTPEQATNAYKTAEAFVNECTPRDAGTIRGRVAANWILDRTSARGVNIRQAAFRADTPEGEKRFTNLYAEFCSDPTSRWVVVVSHFDTKAGSGSPGANDGASTTALLMALSEAVDEWRERHGNLMLVWTDSEECIRGNYSEGDGLQGARQAVEYLRQKERVIQAVIVVDMLGDADLHITIPSNSNPVLAKITKIAAKRIGEEGLVSLGSESVKDDHVPFIEGGYKAVDLIDFNYGPGNRYWHTAEDTMDKLSVESFYRSGRLIAEMINILL